MADASKPLGGKLFNERSVANLYESSPDKYQAHLLEQYKLSVEMADRISTRRQSANSYFLTINTGLVGFIGYVTPKDTNNDLWLLAVAGIALSYLWYRLIRSYRDLNSGKFKVIHFIEERLPLNLFNAEWEAVGRGQDSKLYKPFTHIEAAVPWVFLLLHAIVCLRTIPWNALKFWA